jgi:hypothetical protein
LLDCTAQCAMGMLYLSLLPLLLGPQRLDAPGLCLKSHNAVCTVTASASVLPYPHAHHHGRQTSVTFVLGLKSIKGLDTCFQHSVRIRLQPAWDGQASMRQVGSAMPIIRGGGVSLHPRRQREQGWRSSWRAQSSTEHMACKPST